MRIGVQPRSQSHECHILCGTSAGDKLVRRFSSAALQFRIRIGKVSIHISAVDETADENNRSIGKRLSGGIPPPFLHRQHSGIIKPLAARIGEIIRGSAWVEYSN